MNNRAPGGPSVDLRITAEPPRCPKCGRQALMSAQIPHGWDNPDGSRTSGTLPVVLCTACDADDPAAGALITFFHVHEYVTLDLLHECADLIQRWANSITIPPVDLDALDSETRAWQRGEL